MRLFTDDNLATQCIWAEARGEPQETKIGVGEVIRNRSKTKYLSDGTISGTIWHPLQFSWTNPYDPNRVKAFLLDDEDAIVHSCWQAWQDSETSNLVNGAVNYYSTDIVMPGWASRMSYVCQLGKTRFYKL